MSTVAQIVNPQKRLSLDVILNELNQIVAQGIESLYKEVLLLSIVVDKRSFAISLNDFEHARYCLFTNRYCTWDSIFIWPISICGGKLAYWQ